MAEPLLAPWPYFGGKSKIADEVWNRFGAVDGFVEPFCGSAAVFLNSPGRHTVLGTLNDIDCFLANAWRSIKSNPQETARWACDAISEVDLFAKHLYLVNNRENLQDALRSDPEFHDTQLAGYWIYGISNWIGSGFCTGKGPWNVEDGKVINIRDRAGQAGINSQMPILDHKQGVNSQAPEMHSMRGVNSQMPRLSVMNGVNSNDADAEADDLQEAIVAAVSRRMKELANKLRAARIMNGDWRRALTPSVLEKGKIGIFFDPPYASGKLEYSAAEESGASVTQDVIAWCIENGDNPNYRIAVCGYDIVMPEPWVSHAWKGKIGYSATDEAKANKHKEVVWFNRFCHNQDTKPTLF